MDNSNLLNISNNFSKLLKDCQDGNTFLQPVFYTVSDIDALIVLYQILHIVSNRRLQPTPSNIIVYQTLVSIINIRCREYVEQATILNKNLERFTSTLDTYINTMIDNIMIHSQTM